MKTSKSKGKVTSTAKRSTTVKSSKLDLFKQHRTEYVMPKRPVLIKTGPATYLAVRGKGAPGGESFGRCIGALYAMAFTIKMTRKFAGKQDYTICKLECIYGLDGQGDAFCEAPREEWEWELLIRTPQFATSSDLRAALKVLQSRNRAETADQVVLKKWREGTCVQMLHIGPYQEEGRTIELMKQFASSKGFQFSGSHHEIYISDPRRVKPDQLRTILRHGVSKQ